MLSVAKVVSIWVLLLLSGSLFFVEEVEVVFLGVKALTTANVVSALLPNILPPEEDEEEDALPLNPPCMAKTVAAGELPSELIRATSVVDILLLLSIASAANGLICPLVTPVSSTIFFSGSF